MPCVGRLLFRKVQQMSSHTRRILTFRAFILGAVAGAGIRLAWFILKKFQVSGFGNLSSENLAMQTLRLVLIISFSGYGLIHLASAFIGLKTEKDFLYRASRHVRWFDKQALLLLSVTAGQFFASAVLGFLSWVGLLGAESSYRSAVDLLVVLLCILLALILPSYWFSLNEDDLRHARWSNMKRHERLVSFLAELVIAGLLFATAHDLFVF